MADIPECVAKRLEIDNLNNANQQHQQSILTNINKIAKLKRELNELTEKKSKCTFVYDTMIDNKIGAIDISRIEICSCSALCTSSVCNGLHQISIYGLAHNDRINFDNSRLFTIRELELLNYVQKIVQKIEDKYTASVYEVCQFAKKYPQSVVTHW